MCKKLSILSLSVAILFVLLGSITPVDAGRSLPINWRIAGTIVQAIDVYNPQTGDPLVPAQHSLINLSAIGWPAPAQITLLSRLAGVGSAFGCKKEFLPIGFFDKNDFVAIFPGQSLLFATIAAEGGILCIDSYTDPTTTYFEIKMNITGGKGRFEGATGNFTANGYGYPGFSSDGTMVGENGKITGTINLP